MISWPAANEIRCVKPSIATVSPSRTSSRTASAIEATLEVVIESKDRRCGSRRTATSPTASIPVIAWAASAAWRIGRSARLAGDRGDRLAEDPQRGRHLGLADTSAPATSGPTTCRTRGRAGRAGTRPTGPPRRARPCRTRCRSSGRGRGRRGRAPGSGRGAAPDPASACSPRAAALSTSPPSSRSIVARAAAQATGLPPYVEPCAPGAPRLEQVGPGDHRRRAASRWRSPWPVRRMSGLTPHCSIAHIVPVRPAPDWISSAIEQDPVLVADRAEALEEAVLGDDVAALALDRLDDDRRDLVRPGRACRTGPRRTSAGPRPRPNGAWKTPGRSGPNPAWYFAFDAVSETAP